MEGSLRSSDAAECDQTQLDDFLTASQSAACPSPATKMRETNAINWSTFGETQSSRSQASHLLANELAWTKLLPPEPVLDKNSTSDSSAKTGTLKISSLKDGYACSESGCNKKFTRKSDLQRHMTTIHSPDAKRYPCLYCSKYQGSHAFKRKDKFAEHMRMHNYLSSSAASITTFHCPHAECGVVGGAFIGFKSSLTFNKQAEYQKHMRDLHNETPFHCLAPGCNRKGRLGYLQKIHLEYHQKREHPEILDQLLSSTEQQLSMVPDEDIEDGLAYPSLESYFQQIQNPEILDGPYLFAGFAKPLESGRFANIIDIESEFQRLSYEASMGAVASSPKTNTRAMSSGINGATERIHSVTPFVGVDESHVAAWLQPGTDTHQEDSTTKLSWLSPEGLARLDGSAGEGSVATQAHSNGGSSSMDASSHDDDASVTDYTSDDAESTSGASTITTMGTTRSGSPNYSHELLMRLMSRVLAALRYQPSEQTLAGMSMPSGNVHHSSSIEQNALASVSSSPDATGSSSSRKRKSNGKEEGTGDDGDEGVTIRKRKKVGSPDSGAVLFACPFYKRTPRKHQERQSCRGPGWKDVHRLKEHLYRNHGQPFQCDRCGVQTKDEYILSNHRRQTPACTVDFFVLAEGITSAQKEHLKSRRREVPPLDEPGKWRKMYQIIFPFDHPDDIPSPYYESETPANDKTEMYHEVLRRELPALVSLSLEFEIQAILERGRQPLELDFQLRLGEIVRTVHRGLYRLARQDNHVIFAEHNFGASTGPLFLNPTLGLAPSTTDYQLEHVADGMIDQYIDFDALIGPDRPEEASVIYDTQQV